MPLFLRPPFAVPSMASAMDSAVWTGGSPTTASAAASVSPTVSAGASTASSTGSTASTGASTASATGSTAATGASTASGAEAGSSSILTWAVSAGASAVSLRRLLRLLRFFSVSSVFSASFLLLRREDFSVFFCCSLAEAAALAAA